MVMHTDNHKTLNTSKRLYSIKELANEVGATEWFWRNQIWGKRLPVIRVGRKQFVDAHDLEEFIEAHKSFN